MADNYDKDQRNTQWGFKCLHLSVSEANAIAAITIENKQGAAGKITVRTRDDTATAPEDYKEFNETLTFKAAQSGL